MAIVSRRTFLSTLGLAALGGLLAACGANVSAAPEARSNKPRQNAPQAAPGDLRAFAAGHNRFGLAMYRLLGDGNLFFSPYSIAQVLTMTRRERAAKRPSRWPKRCTRPCLRSGCIPPPARSTRR